MPEFLQLMESMDGFSPVHGMQLDETAMAKAISLINNEERMPIHRWEYLLKEAITTSDFPYLFGGVLDRSLLAAYLAAVADWRSYCYVGSSRDFRAKNLHKVQGNDQLLPRVAEKGEYLVSPVQDAYYSLQVYKYGRQFDISWEAIINDDMGAFSDVAQRFAEAARYTEAYLVTSLFASAAGPNALLFGAPIVDIDGQGVTNQGVLPLTIQNLETTMELMAAQTDVNGRPLGIRGKHLVVPPGLEFTARQILTSATKMWVDQAGGAGAAIPYPMNNVIAQMGLQLHVDPLLPVIDATGNDNGTWYLFADPSDLKAMEFDYLRGHESPEVCMKASDKVSPTGAPLSPFSGDFATDNIFYRVRICCGGTQLDPRAAYAQVNT